MVAAFEATKGIVVLAAGAGLFSLAHRDIEALAIELVEHLHLNPASRYPGIFLAAAEHLGNARLQLLALGAFAYAIVHLAEAYGLWRQRPWAEWLAVMSAGFYIPFEIYELAKGVSALKLALLGINVVILAYLSRVLWRNFRHKDCK